MININKKSNLPKLLVVAALIVDQQSRVLIAQRPVGKSMAGLWEFPGGKVHIGETRTKALARELKEELAMTVQENALHQVIEVKHAYEDFMLIMPLYLCRQWQGDIIPLEGQRVVWVKPEDLVNYPMPPADKPIIDKIPSLLKLVQD